ncbi:hypothetical protein EGH90_06120 [Kaistella haifensis]|nr:hypothetical protein EGH90_06120 [Kaistella haifensis]
MKFLIIIFTLMCNIIFAQNLKELRNYLIKGEKSSAAAIQLMEKSEALFKQNKLPIYKGFYSVGQFFMAKHAANPFKKLSYFKEGKKSLNHAIDSDSKNLELRLFRLMTQEQAPAFLNYTDNIKEDRSFILKNYENETDEDLKIFIKKYLKK